MHRRSIVFVVLGVLLSGASLSSSGGVVQTKPADDANSLTYCAATNTTVNTGTTNGTVTSIAYIFHPASVTKRYRVRWSQFHGAAGTGTGKYLLHVTPIAAENGTPGGTLITPTPSVPTNPASNAIFRVGATGAPTRATNDVFTLALGATDPVHTELHVEPGFQPFTLPASVAAGFELRTEVTTTLTGGADVALWVCWTED